MFGSQPPPPSPEELKAQVSLAMLTVVGALQPVYDTADGMRRDLESRGWSPTMAEQAAGTWLCTILATLAGTR
jgi:hypothetical protein